jgi:predicted permease
LSLLLAIVAGLLVTSVRNLHGFAWGFRPEHVAVFELQHNPVSREPEALANAATAIAQRVQAVPGVDSSSVSMVLLFSTADQRTSIHIPGYIAPPAENTRLDPSGRVLVSVRFNPVSPGFFETVAMPLLAGRTFDDRDRRGAPHVAVINQSMARRYFGSQNAVGRTFLAQPEPRREASIEVIGVVGDSKYNNLREDVRPMFYAPFAQFPRTIRGLHVRTQLPLAAIAPSIRRAIADATPDVMVLNAASLADRVDRTLSAERLIMRLATFFGAVALLLAGIGLYGVLAYQVAQRRGEIGVRLALGATRRIIVRLVLHETAATVLCGIGLGLALSLTTTRWLRGFLFGLSPTDASTIVTATAILIACSALASYIPARRAAGVDPNVALREP